MNLNRIMQCIWVGVLLLWSSSVFAQDLQVTGLTPSTTLPKFGQQITLSVTIENKSSRTATASVAGVYYSQNNSISTSSDPRIATINVPQLTANGKHQVNIQVTVPPFYGSGQRWLGVVADYNNRVRETSENNNIRVVALTVQIGTGADLIPTVFTASKTKVGVGEQISVSFTINNIGNADAGATTAAFVLSTNTTITMSDPKILEVNVPQIKAGSSYRGTATLTVPSATGTRYLGIFVDPRPNNSAEIAGKVPEINEENNTKYVQLTITTADLELRSLLVTPGNFKANDTIAVTVEVHNTGQLDAGPTTLGLYFSSNTSLDTTGISRDTLVQSVNVPAIKAGLSSNVKATFQVTSTMLQGFTGSFYVLAHADDKKVLAEASESNNLANVRVNVNGVDLIVTQFAISPTPRVYAQNEEVTVSFTVRNNGNATANASTASIHYSTDANFSVADTRLGTVNVPSLAAGKDYTGTAKVRIPNTATLGSTRYLFAYADGLRRISEADENNNDKGESFVVGSINFQATAVSVTPTSGRRGTQVTLTYTIKNTGNKEAPPSVVGLYWSYSSTITTSSTRLSDQRIPKIDAGKEYKGTATLTVPTSARTGRIYFGVYADRNSQIAESSESFLDNGKSTAFTVLENVDLEPTLLTPSSTNPYPNTRLTVNVAVKNNGTDTSGSYYVRIYYSTDNKYDSTDTYMGQDVESGLAGGASRTAQATNALIPASATGTGYLIAFVDALQRVSETNENNNILVYKITIRQRSGPDVIPDKVEPSNLTPKAGDAISVKVTVKNVGTATTGQLAALSLYLSTNSTFSTQDTFLGTATMPVIASGQQAVLTMNVQIPAGVAAQQHWLFAYVDSQRTIAEGNESNNVKGAIITVVKANDPDNDKDGVPASKDCDDNDKLTYPAFNGRPAAPEICDGKDNNCNRVVDENNGLCPTGQICDKTAKKCIILPSEPGPEPGPGPEPVIDTAPGPEPPRPDAGPGPEPSKPDAGPGPEPSKPDAGPGPEPPKPDAGPGPEPPLPDAGPADIGGCPGGCPMGEVCINDQCVPLPTPDDDENTPEDQEGQEGANDPTESTTDAGTDAGPDASPTQDQEPTDTSQSKDDAPDTSTTTDTSTTDASVTTDAPATTDSGSKEGGTSNDTGSSLPEVPVGGCACTLSSGTPLAPVLLLTLFVLVAFRRKNTRVA